MASFDLEEFQSFRNMEDALAAIKKALSGGVEHFLAQSFQAKQPVSLYGCAETALAAYGNLMSSWELQAAKVRPAMDTFSHPMFTEYSRKLHVLHAAEQGCLSSMQVRNASIGFSVIICILYYEFKQCDPHRAYIHLRVLLDGYDREAGRPDGTTREAILSCIRRGDAFQALARFHDACGAFEGSWDLRSARECLGIDRHGVAREQMAKVLAEKINHVLSITNSPDRVSEQGVYSELETVLDHFTKHRIDAIVRLIGIRAWK